MSFFQYPIYDIPEISEERKFQPVTPLTIIVNKDEYQEDQEILLGKIIGAAKQDISSATIKKMSSSECIKLIAYANEDQLIIAFNISPARLGLQVSKQYYNRIVIGNSRLILAHSLVELPDHMEARRALWHLIKEYYQL